jgi:diacylglycerol kinase family enzyme
VDSLIFSSAAGQGKRTVRVTLIHNRSAGEEEHPSVEELMAFIGAAGHDVTYQSSKDDRWETALQDPGDLVAVAGGDGTVGAVADHIIGRRIPIGVLPLGTANNVAKTLGLADTALEELIEGWVTARRIEFDAGVAHGPWGMTHFIEGVGVGLLATAMPRLDPQDGANFARLDDLEGRVPAALKELSDLVLSFPGQKLKLVLDGQDLSGEYILLEVMNTQLIGPNLRLAPHADPSDGHLNVVLVPAGERDGLREYLGSCVKGDSQPPPWPVRTGQRFRLEWEGSEIHIDDKVWPSRDSIFSKSQIVADMCVRRHALEFLV